MNKFLHAPQRDEFTLQGKFATPGLARRRKARHASVRAARYTVELLEPRTLLSVSAATVAGPFKVAGTTRTYQVTINGTVTTGVTQTVVGQTTFQGITCYEQDTGGNGIVTGKAYYGLDSSGNFVEYGSVSPGTTLSQTTVYAPPRLIAASQNTANMSSTGIWTSTVTQTNSAGVVTSIGQESGSEVITLQSNSLVSVTVPANSQPYQAYDATDVETDRSTSGSVTRIANTENWFVPSIGLVKSVTTAQTFDVNGTVTDTHTSIIEMTNFAGRNNYAVLFVGGYNAANNHVRYSNALKSIYQTITSDPYNLDPTHIYVLYADAPNTTAPLSDTLLPSDQESGGTIVDSDLSYLLDGTNVMSGTSASLNSALTAVDTNIDDTGSFFFWSFDHGNGTSGATANDGADVLNGWGDTTPDATVAQWLNPIFAKAGHATAVFNQCFSGGILDHLTTGSNDFACAAASYEEPSWSDTFAVQFTRAIQLGLPTGMDDYRFAYATDTFATDGEGGQPPSPPGPTLVANTEHPWASGGSFPVLPLNPSTATPSAVTALPAVTAGAGPMLSSVSTLPSALPNQPRIITYDELLADSTWSNPTGQQIDFQIDAVSSGTLGIETQAKNGGSQTATPVVPGTTVVGYGQELVWIPPSGASGVTNAFTVEASDGQSLSGTPIAVQANVATPAVLLTVSRNGGNASSATATTPTLNFPAAFLQAADPAQIFTLTDAGTQAVVLTGLALGGTNPGDFTVTLANGSPLPASMTINPGTSVTIRALFQPQASGARSATIMFSTNELASPGLARTLVLSGEGLANIPPILTRIAPLSGAPLGQAATISYDELVAASDLSDSNPMIDEVVLRIVSVDAGTLTLNGQPVVPGLTDIGLGQSVQWTPPAGAALGPMQAFSVRANDFFQMSATAVPATVVVGGLNHAPDFTASNPPDAAIGTAQTVAGWVTSFNAGDAGQAVLAYQVVNLSNPALFSVAPTITSDGTLSYTVATAGVSTFDVTVQDNGGTANGGIDTSPAHTFVIIANPQITPTPAVSLIALKANASQANPATSGRGRFQISRSGSVKQLLVVSYTISGTAVPGNNYQPLSGYVVIPAGKRSATIDLTPIDNDIAQPSQTVVLSVAGDAAYNVDARHASATVTIADNSPTVSVTAARPRASEIRPTTTGQGSYLFTRVRGDASQPLTVLYQMSGTAISGTDYVALSGSVTIPAGRRSVLLALTPIDDMGVEASETAILTLLPDSGPSYNLDPRHASATVTIIHPTDSHTRHRP